MNPLRVLVLDFDGVILDSNAAKTRAFERLFAKDPVNQARLMEYHLRNFSAPRGEKIEYWVHQLLGRPQDTALVEQRLAEYGQLVAAELAKAPLVPGAEQLLKEFAKQVPIYVASVTPQTELQQTLARLGLAGYIKKAYGDPPHPKADALRDILKAERARPSEVVFIGDQPSDQLAAASAGVPFLPRDSGTRFTSPHPEPVKDLHEALEILRPRVQPA